jgi:hypothetical protein
MTNRIQLRRDTSANWSRVNPILEDGEPGLDITTNQIKYGDGSTVWDELPYASGGAGLTDVDGLVTFPGNFLIGTLWPDEPMPEGDKESVVWAKDDTEYLGLWWGGDQTYPEMGYGPVAGIMIGAYDDMTDDFTDDPSPADTNVTIGINDSNGDTLEWRFDRTGNLTLPEGSTISETNTTTVITPPGALAGQSLVLRGTSPTGITSNHPDGFAPGDIITITVTPDNSNPVTGTIDYTFTGCTSIQLGRALTGTLTFTSQANQTVTWTVPALSDMTTFTFTLSNPSGIGLAGVTTLTLTGTGSSEASHIHLISGNPTTVDLYLGDDDQYVKIEKNAGNVVIGTNTDTNHWTFGTDGSLTLPTGTTISSTSEIVSVTLDQFTDGGYPGTQVFTKVSDTLYELSPGGPNMILISAIWYLKISVSTYYSSTDLITWEAVAGGLPEPVGTLGTLATMNLGVGGNVWAFNGNGDLTFPDSTTQTTAFGITGFGEGFSLTAADKIVTNKLYSTNASSPTQHYRLELDTNGVVVLPDQSIINGSTLRGIYGTGELNYTGITIGPDTNHREESWVWVDHTGVSIATEYSTDAYTWKFDNNGNLTLPTGGEIHSAAGTGSVAIEANDGNNTRTWTFGTDGSLTFPDTTTQSTAYKRTTGSWTVATGSDTYSFTVPLNGTYSMWVKGAIDNGIIVWNATASVSNTNVPVIGQQYAWNYTGGGTPIEFTEIPTQFIGTANNIVSSNPSVGTTSNKFDFVINNTSGSEQTVYWGYVTQ